MVDNIKWLCRGTQANPPFNTAAAAECSLPLIEACGMLLSQCTTRFSPKPCRAAAPFQPSVRNQPPPTNRPGPWSSLRRKAFECNDSLPSLQAHDGDLTRKTIECLRHEGKSTKRRAIQGVLDDRIRLVILGTLTTQSILHLTPAISQRHPRIQELQMSGSQFGPSRLPRGSISASLQVPTILN